MLLLFLFGAPATAMVATSVATLSRSIKTPDPIPEEGIAAAVECMRSGRLFRYNVNSRDESYVSLCEADFAAYTGFRFALGMNSCGSALFVSLKCAGVKPGDGVLTNGFTFTAVPSAIVHAEAVPVYVECTDGYVVDVDDLEKKIIESGAKFFMISHMRGKVADMDAVKELCDEHDVVLMEDCAHALGVQWKGMQCGHHGAIASFSSQSYKMLNSGEGGFLATNDDDYFAAAMAYAGAYESLAKKHITVPKQDSLATFLDGSIPNYSLRMHEASAAMLRPQIETIDSRRAVYNDRYEYVVSRLQAKCDHVVVPDQLKEVTPVADSLQFNVPKIKTENIDLFLSRCEARGLPVERFGAANNARNFENWKYAPLATLPQTKAIISKAFDVRLPLRFHKDELDLIADIIADELNASF
ncbi:hypothetical protein CTAYLR_009306 [Chrysophaeum taylorii]|uniref:Aminotransferase n=1 Tax=Chrysophaeum taylorii TaxID=2483200 RepID=A0AAD7UKU9_9STRA|nr:hypothetical protein CTAYLR_009306 [Chrysophaeum taylorii]